MSSNNRSSQRAERRCSAEAKAKRAEEKKMCEN
jgi:hypothetical protein